MTDWKKRIDSQLEAEEKKKAQKQKRKQEKESTQRKRSKQFWGTLFMFWHQLRFRCNVCGKPSEEPAIGGGGYEPLADYSHPTYEDWSAPGDLKKCTRCRKWACEKHLHREICKNCA